MKNISIIGSGLSGSLLTINLIKNWKGDKLNINLIERDPQKFNTGIAYSTEEFTNILNVRCSNMSIFPDDPDNFYNWLKKFGYTYTKNDFVPRSIFGQYIKYNFKHTIVNKPNNINFNSIFDEVIDITKTESNYKLSLQNNEDITSDLVVLAIGNISPIELDILKSSNIKNYVKSPWSEDFFKKLKLDEDILFIGSGLMFQDIILSLNERKHKGKFYSISENEYQPFVHKLYDTYPSFHEELKGKDINQIFHIVRSHVKKHTDPTVVIDSIIPYVPNIWKSLSKTDKLRFIRHLSSLWNSICHRTPESTSITIGQLLESNRLEIIKGEILKIDQQENKIKVQIFNEKKIKIEVLNIDLIINCNEPEHNYKKINLPLIKNLIKSGIIQYGKESITIKTNNYNIIDENNSKLSNLVAIGPILKGELYECNSVIEIRKQTAELSNIIIKYLKKSEINKKQNKIYKNNYKNNLQHE